MRRNAFLGLVVLLAGARPASAEWQVRPFLGVTLGGETTFIDLEQAAGTPNVATGVTWGLVGEVLGIEADLGHAPGYFQAGDEHLVLRSSVTTLTGNVTVALPRRMTEYTLRPYFVGGAGLVHARISEFLGPLRVAENLTTIDLGGGATGFLTRRVGINWDVRHFRSVRGRTTGVSFGAEELSFWRANVALAIRY